MYRSGRGPLLAAKIQKSLRVPCINATATTGESPAFRRNDDRPLRPARRRYPQPWRPVDELLIHKAALASDRLFQTPLIFTPGNFGSAEGHQVRGEPLGVQQGEMPGAK